MGARKVEATLTQCLFATVARLNAELTTLIVITIGKATRPRGRPEAGNLEKIVV